MLARFATPMLGFSRSSSASSSSSSSCASFSSFARRSPSLLSPTFPVLPLSAASSSSLVCSPSSSSPSSSSSRTPFASSRSISHDTSIGVNSMGKIVQRPVSPHVTIYSQPIPAISSIMNRATGVMLSIGLAGASLVSLTVSCDLPAYVHQFQLALPALVPIAKIIVSFPLIYHSVAGLRHLYWDATAKMLDLPSVELSSKIVIGVSIVLSIGTAFITLPAIA